jgi:hypothetical protein
VPGGKRGISAALLRTPPAGERFAGGGKGIMKLSEAMRLADELELPELRGEYVAQVVEKWGGEKPPCCAIGGAAIACGGWQPEFIESYGGKRLVLTGTAYVSAMMPQVDDAELLSRQCRRQCPVCRARFYERFPQRGWTFRYYIEHLFDQHKWSRTRIANWIDNPRAKA